MKIVNQHSPVQRLTKIVFALLFVFSISLSAQDAANGKKLFQANCAACHKLDKKLVGPALKGITEKRENKWLKAWIKDNNALRKSGDADAKQVFEENNKMPMTAFPQLSDKDIDDILAYTDGKATKKAAAPATGGVDPKVAEGKKLFKTNCAACHKLDKKLVGPPLKGITEKRETAWLHKWIKDNNALRASGDALAKQVFEENNKMPMTTFPQLKDSDIDKILAYLTVGDVKKAVAGTKNATKTNTKKSAKAKSSSSWTDWVVILAILALLFIAFKSKVTFVKIIATIFILIGAAYYLFNSLMSIGIDQGYQPIQPIAFSHKIHAGDNKIDCQYCHSSAKHSKVSGVPTANVCMNCHKSISEVAEDTKVGDLGKKELDKEIQKIYDAIGWDKDNFKYKENYKQKPIKWTRVHNLQDFVYYNHSQHVTVAGLKCQTCHGPVETYDEMKQFAPLTMRWCLDCHKSKEVNMDNKYYTKIHEELKKTGVDKATIAELGGRECGKCHY